MMENTIWLHQDINIVFEEVEEETNSRQPDPLAGRNRRWTNTASSSRFGHQSSSPTKVHRSSFPPAAESGEVRDTDEASGEACRNASPPTRRRQFVVVAGQSTSRTREHGVRTASRRHDIVGTERAAVCRKEYEKSARRKRQQETVLVFIDTTRTSTSADKSRSSPWDWFMLQHFVNWSPYRLQVQSRKRSLFIFTTITAL